MTAQTLRGRIALVTGATRGIGRAAAIALGSAGAHAIALGRKAEALEALDDEIRAAKGEATLVPVDLRDFEALDRLGATINEHWKRLDVLVLNAAVQGPVMPLAQMPPKAFAEALETNLIANWRLLRSMDPLLRRSEAGRVVALTCEAARSPRAFLGVAALTKASLEAMIRTYAAECDGTPIKANLLDPGPVRTEMRARLMPGEDPMSLPAPEAVAPLILELASAAWGRTGETVTFGSRA